MSTVPALVPDGSCANLIQFKLAVKLKGSTNVIPEYDLYAVLEPIVIGKNPEATDVSSTEPSACKSPE